jgi:hypothetical protein
MSQSHLLPPAIAGSVPWRVSIDAFHLSRMHLSATCSASYALFNSCRASVLTFISRTHPLLSDQHLSV